MLSTPESNVYYCELARSDPLLSFARSAAGCFRYLDRFDFDMPAVPAHGSSH